MKICVFMRRHDNRKAASPYIVDNDGMCNYTESCLIFNCSITFVHRLAEFAQVNTKPENRNMFKLTPFTHSDIS